MKRALKIFGITLGSTIGFILLVLAVALWVLFTPARLTPIVRDVANHYVKCEHEIGKVELTFFSTFPHFGLAVDSVLLVNAVDGAANDTLLAAPKLVAAVDVVGLMQKKLHVSELLLSDIQANIFVDSLGVSNLDVFNLPSDTTAEDTSAFSLPFQEIQVDELCVSAKSLHVLSLRDSIDATISGMAFHMQVESWSDMDMQLTLAAVDATLKGVQYANQLRVSADIPAAVDVDAMRVAFRQARVGVNQFEVAIDGWAQAGETIDMDIKLGLQEWKISDVLALVPPCFLSSLDGISADGILSLDVQAQGVYSDTLLPVVDAHVVLKDGMGKYAELPYTIEPLNLDANLHLDMQNKAQSEVKINNFFAHTRASSIQGKGIVKDPLGKLWVDVKTEMDVKIADVEDFLPKDMLVAGQVKGKVQMQMYLEDLLAMQLEKGRVQGDLLLNSVQYEADSLYAQLPANRLTFQIPNVQPTRKEVNWLAGTLSLANAEVKMGETMQAELGKTNLEIEISDILSQDPRLYATISLDSKEYIHAQMDSMDITINKPAVALNAIYNMKDTLEMPTVDAQVAFERVYGYYSDIKVDVAQSSLKAGLHAPQLTASVLSQSLQASMGTDLAISTGRVGVEASVRYNKKRQDNLLLQWRPKLSVDLKQAEVLIADWEQKLLIPEIEFTYSNQACHIEQSRLILGNSDFSLTGDVRNIGRWLRDRGTLEGELNFVSEHTDANELLSILSAEQGSEEESSSQSDTTSAQPAQPTDGASPHETTEPFLVPTNVDLVLNTQIKQANFLNQTARNLGGKIYVKDGTLVLEEVGFICNAAKLQLTAMYRTPRRNHIYVGFDYHMIDINIQELIGMIPQIDSMMPMLNSFRGEAEFHLAAETYTNAQYKIKPSTLRGAASIFGKDLVVLDNETFSKISKLLMFNKKTENKVDSISAEVTLYKKEIDVYPFAVSMDNYMFALGGRHNLDMTFNYDVNVLSPIYLGVNVSGSLDDLDIKLAPCKYAKDFKPIFHRKVNTQSAELRSMIRESMRKNVKIQ
jgi:hypothetical protein